MTKRIFVTGSTDGIGLETARQIVAAGHEAVLHARNEKRAAEARRALPAAAEVVVGDLASLRETKALAEAAAKAGPFDAIIHNAGITGGNSRIVTEDGLEQIFQVNVLAPYILTSLMPLPKRLIYITSGMASGGTIDLQDLQRERRPWSATDAYCDSKLCDLALALAMARHHPDTACNAVCPGWVRTKMGGMGAPTDVTTGAATQVWLATSDEAVSITGRYFRHMKELELLPEAKDIDIQEGLLKACAALSRQHA